MKRILLLVLLFGFTLVHAQNAPNGNSLSFDGINDYVSITAAAPLSFTNSSFTIETWIKTKVTSAGILTKSNGNTSWENGERAFYLESDGSATFVGYGNEFIRSNKPVNDGNWHHIAVTFDGNNGRIYVDGVDKTSSSNYANNNPDMGTLALGLPNYAEAPNYFKGELDQMRIWNVARTASEIQQNFKTKTPATVIGLIAVYTFNQGNPNTENATISSLNNQLGADYKGEFHNFALNGDVSNFIKIGSANNALNFAGAQVVNVPTATTAVSGSFTVELWVNPKDYSNQSLFSTRQDNGASFDISLLDNYRVHGDLGDGTNWYNTNVDAYPGWNPGTWMHIAYVVSPSDVKIFINGQYYGQQGSGPSPLLFNANTTFQIGSNGNEPNANSGIDEVKIYNTALTQDQVKADMQKGVISMAGNLVAYYDFDQGTPNGDNTGLTILLDKSSNALNGTLTGFALTGDDSNWIGTPSTYQNTPYTYIGAAPEKNRVTVNWYQPYGGTANSYNLEVAKDSNFSELLPAYNGLTVNGLVGNIKGLQPSTTYYYRVSANFSITGESDYSNFVQFTTAPATVNTTNIVLNFNQNYYNYVELDKNPIAATANFTYETWFQYDGTNIFPRLFDFNNGAGNNVLFGINPNNKLDFYIQSNGQSENLEGGIIMDKGWHHAAITVENGIWTSYFDGDQIAQSSGHTLSPLTVGATTYNWLGRSAYNDPIFYGSMDNVRIWDIARTPLEIKNNYKLTLDPATANLVTYYDFNQGTPGGYNGFETKLFDLTANNNNGTLNGFGLNGTISNWINKVPTPILTSSAQTNTSITANWTIPVSATADSYLLEVATDAGFTNFVAGYNKLSLTAKTKEITGLTSNTVYYLRVTAATAEDGEGSVSNVITRLTQSFEIATAATDITHTSLKANWTAPVTPLQNFSYHVEIATDALFTKVINEGNTSDLSYDFKGLNFNTAYYYRVRLVSNEIGESGNSNVITATTTTLTPPPGNALAFDYNAGNHAVVTSSFYPSGSTGYTIEAWVNPKDMNSNAGLGILGYGNYGNTNQVNAFRFGGGQGSYELRNYWWGNDIAVSIPDISGKWTHVAATYDNVSGVRTLYMNGAVIVTDNPGANVLNAPSVNIVIGKTVGGEYFNGEMDEVRVFSTARTAAEIDADMRNIIPKTTPGLVAYYNFDHGFASVDNNGNNKLYDQISEENTGLLNNFSLTGTTSNWVPSYAMKTPLVPTATIATQGTLNSFVANWTGPVINSTVNAYHIDVATDATFTTILPAYNNLQIAGTSIPVTGLTEGQTYYYRVRAFNVIGESANSNVISRLVKLDPPGNALAFDGTDDKVIIGTATSFNATTMKTVEAWVKFSSFAGAQEIISKSVGSKGLEIITLNNNLSVYMMGGGNDQHIDYPLSNLQLNKWYHIATTFDGPGTAMNLYINGVSVANGTAPASMQDSAQPLILGSWAQDNLRPFNGVLDEVRVWNIQRTAVEIAANYKLIVPANTAGLTAYYNFDQGEAAGANTLITALIDLTTGQQNGILNNFALTGNTSNWLASFALVRPIALAATLVTNSSFTANFEAQTYPVITGYKIDVATDAAFANILPAYNDLTIATGNTLLIGNLAPGLTYYYRVRATSSLAETSINSNTESTTLIALTPPGNALAFNQVNNQHVVLPGTAPYDFGTGDFTLEAYVNTLNTGVQIILGNLGNGAYWFGTNDGKLQFDVNGQSIQSSRRISDGNWHHVSIVRSQGIGYLYIDGILDGSGQQDNSADINSNLSISGFSNGDYAWSGLIDEVRVYNAALTVANINADLLSTTVAVPANLVAYYNFDQGVAGADNTLNTTLFDQSPNAYHGSLQGFALTGTASNFVKSYALVKPTAGAATAITTTGFTANWTASTFSTADKYYIDVATDADFNNIVVANQEATGTSVVVTGLDSYTDYFYRVRALNSLITGQSINSNVATFRTLSPNAELSDIVLSAGTLAPTFETTTLAYTAAVANSVTAITLKSTTTAATSTIAINGDAVASGADSQSYTLAIGENTFNIVVTAQDGTTTKTYEVKVTRAKTAQTITFATTATATYGAADFTPGATSTNTDYTNYPITYTSSDLSVATIVAGKVHVLKVGSTTITASQAGDASFIAATNKEQVLTINKKALTIAAAGTNKVYDGNTTATVTLSDDRVTGDVLTTAYIGATFNNQNVATGKAVAVTGITLTGTSAVNYSFNTTASTTANITAKTLTITADNKSRLQGAANPAFTLTYAGFITGETTANLTAQPLAGTTADASSIPGDYDINVTGATATNYAITQVKGKLTVNAAVITNVVLTATSLYENSAANTSAGTLSSTSNDAAGTYTYTLVSGTGATDNGKFNISGNSIRINAPLDYEAQTTYAVRVKTTSQYNVVFEKELIINLLDVNEAPTLDAIANAAICYTTTAQSLPIGGITGGPETAQTTTVTVSSNNANLFESLTAAKTGAVGTVNYRVKNNATGSATVTVTVTDNGGTANGGVNTTTRSFVITINALPVVAISSDKGTAVSKGEIVKLTATGGTTYVWSANSSIISGQNTATLTVKPTVTTTYTVTASNATTCSDVKTITIEVADDFAKVKPMNILSPNGDGYNDKWIVENIDLYPSNQVTIYDLAGRVVYTKTAYDNSWDGSYKGTPLKEGVYYYIIDFGPKYLKFKGSITILKNN